MSDTDRPAGPKERTLDGKRLSMRELNTGIKTGGGRARRFFNGLSQFLAGMYTGESCAGSPHSERHRGEGAEVQTEEGKASQTKSDHQQEQGP
jgi:hypothetical protein